MEDIRNVKVEIDQNRVDKAHKTPTISGEYVNVYVPTPDVFPGPDSLCFRAGQVYDEWIPNDFTVVKGPDNRWHALGITHPAPPDYRPPFEYNLATIHDGEWLLFHAASQEGTLKENLRADTWKDRSKVLYPAERPEEGYEIYAPHAIEVGGVYYMVYGPDPIRLACSKDLYRWKTKGKLFSGHPSARDPNLLFFDDTYIMTYVSENQLLSRSSKDLVHWTEPVEIFRLERKGVPESPFMIKYEELFYLFWCIWDGVKGAYDNRTFVYCSDNPYGFRHECLIAQLQAHAPEIICDEFGDWYIFSAEWPFRGISVAPLEWK